MPSKNKLVLLLLIFILGVFGQILIIAPSGIYLNGDLVFWSSHGHDGLWHIALMQEYQKGYPLQNPVFFGERLVNYHFFSDIAPADFNHYFKLPTLDLYFRFFPLLYSVLLGSLAFLLGKKMGGSFSAGLWATFFTYFAGSFGYIVTYLQNKSVGGESIFWASQPQSSIGNPPQIAAFIIVLIFLYLSNIFTENKDKTLFLICVMLTGSLAVFKIYGAVVLSISLGIVGIWEFIRQRKINNLFLFLAGGLLSAILYFPNSSGASSFLIFQPWWFVRTMIVAPDRLNWIDLELRRQTYIAEGNFKRVIQIEATGFLIFFFGNLGMRFLGLVYFIKILNTFLNNYLYMLLLTICSISLILPLLFLQKGVASNAIQFLQYFLLVFGVFAGISLASFLNKIKSSIIKILSVFIIIVLAIPTQLGLINNFYSRPPFAKIEKGELEALNFLKNNADDKDIILTPPFNRQLNLQVSTPPIWAWSDTGYVSAISSRRTYLADTEQVDIMGYDLKKRVSEQDKIFNQTDPKLFVQDIKTLNIRFIYFPILLRPKVDLLKTSLSKVFSNPEVEIWKI